MLAKHCYRV